MNGSVSSELKKAYDILRRETPLGFYNCGRLCDGLCCRGDETGMWLFPGEEKLFENKPGFEVCETEGNYGYPMVICDGECNRNERPLACRIFPLFPSVSEEAGEITIRVILDPRATMCPLTGNAKRFDDNFVKAVHRAAQYLVRDKEQREYLIKVSEELDEIKRLKNLLTK